MVLTAEERARREPWGRMEEATHDALQPLHTALRGLPEGDAKDEIAGWISDVDTILNEAAQVAIDAAHSTG